MFEFLSQRFGRDVREGKRRQYNYIGMKEVKFMLVLYKITFSF